LRKVVAKPVWRRSRQRRACWARANALDGEEFLGVDGLVDGDEVFAEAGDLVEFFEADDGEGGGGESVFAGVLGGAGFAFWGTGPGGLGGVGSVGG
jgi:hypothetical protein